MLSPRPLMGGAGQKGTEAGQGRASPWRGDPLLIAPPKLPAGNGSADSFDRVFLGFSVVLCLFAFKVGQRVWGWGQEGVLPAGLLRLPSKQQKMFPVSPVAESRGKKCSWLPSHDTGVLRKQKLCHHTHGMIPDFPAKGAGMPGCGLVKEGGRRGNSREAACPRSNWWDRQELRKLELDSLNLLEDMGPLSSWLARVTHKSHLAHPPASLERHSSHSREPAP